MSYINDQDIKGILNLKSSELITSSIADRQLEVIRKGFNFLNQPENNALYIADEVGLGKTYIGLGIASMLRHFSKAPESYQDVILVPKENLQNKWEKEILQFTQKNYLPFDNIVKSVIGHPIGKIHIHEKLEPITLDLPGYHIYRNSSFSFGFSYNSPKLLKDNLFSHLTNPISIELLKKAENKGYLLANNSNPLINNKDVLKKFYAYLLSINNPDIELLIVDEGHNFKYGLGNHNDDIVSDRNNVTSRFFGIKKDSESDKIIFQDFPELNSLIYSKVKKLIILSATPKTESLLEFKKQLDCFLPKHLLSNAKSESEIKLKLNSFVIRGKMEYELNNTLYSRNQCRFEHRKGNVEKSLNTEGLKLQDNEQSLVMGLLQYNTIKHLNAKHNASFELGMLAGFETFKIDQEKKSEEPEYEETKTQKNNKSNDSEVLGHIINSYSDQFGTLPPHPKQDAIVDAAFKMMKNGEKSLIFVRRVASAYELERRLLDRWEKEVIAPEVKKLQSTPYKSDALSTLSDAFEEYDKNKLRNKKLNGLFIKVINKLLSNPKEYPFDFPENIALNEANLKIALYYVDSKYKTLKRGLLFNDEVTKHLSLSIIRNEFLKSCYDYIIETYAAWKLIVEADGEAIGQDEDEDESYFFHSYFNQPHIKVFRKSRIHSTNWFDLNYYLINKRFQIAGFKVELLKNGLDEAKETIEFKEIQETFLKYIDTSSFSDNEISSGDFPENLAVKNTLITDLLMNVFEIEFNHFIAELKRKNKSNSDIFREIKVLATIIKSSIRNGIGFLPLYIADNAEGDIISNYAGLIKNEASPFHSVKNEISTIIKDYDLLRAVNFPENSTFKEIESKLIYQSPVKGMSGIKKNKSKVASQFRMPGYPFVLITTDIFREGEDLHTYCQNIYHYGIAWNCSDMEQRTGRIDRINSKSNRLMNVNQHLGFEEKIHVYFPYLEKTLEVNQVKKLFTSVNNFTKAFDIVDSINEDGMASVSDAVEEMPIQLDVFMRSQFEHNYFTGYTASGETLKTKETIGLTKLDLDNKLREICLSIQDLGHFYLKPEIKYDKFSIIGDMQLVNRNNRRGPFRIQIFNSDIPGQFNMEFSSYLFKTSSKTQRAINEYLINNKFEYLLIDIEDYKAISYSFNIEKLQINSFNENLLRLIESADEIEEKLTKGEDNIIFG
jgi:hypothetical protein